jgi:polysaccharide pyruvyl transferase WcaK-like protein
MRQLLLLNDNSDQDNWGAQATPYALKRMLHDTIPDLTIVALPYSWMAQQFRRLRIIQNTLFERSRVPRFVGRFTDPAEFFPSIVDDFDYFADRWIAGHGGPMAAEFMAEAEKAEVIALNGEQYMWRNSIEGCRALFLLWFARTRLKKPSCLLNHTAHLTSAAPIMPGMVKRVYPVLDVVTVREVSSFRNLRDLGIKNIELVPDVVFYLNESDYAEESLMDWKKQVGLDGQPYFCISGATLPMSVPRDGWTGTVTQLVNRLKETGLKPVLMAKDSHCQYMLQVAKETGAVFFGPEHAFQELWPLLRGAEFVVTGHYHYVIIGAMVGCPFIPLSANTHKMQGICEHLNWHRTTPYDATSLKTETEDIAIEVEQIIRNRAVLSEHLLKESSRLRIEAVKNAELIAGILRANVQRARQVEVYA